MQPFHTRAPSPSARIGRVMTPTLLPGQITRVRAPLLPPRAAPRDDDALRALAAPLAKQIGSEYGEGFVTFRRSGARRLDVDELNRVFAPAGALRLRYAARPDEALAALFDAEVLFDLHAARRHAWASVAAGRGAALPDAVAAAAAGAATRLHPSDAALRCGLTTDPEEAATIALEVAHAYTAHVASELATPRPGVCAFVGALSAAGCAVAAVGALDSASLRSALRRSGLDALAPACGSLEDGDAVAQRLLASALRLGHAPRACVAFVPCAGSIAAAHNASMRAVGVASPSARRHELARADATVGRVDELTAYNLRRLFANAGSELMDLAKDKIVDNGGGGRWQARERGVAGGLA